MYSIVKMIRRMLEGIKEWVKDTCWWYGIPLSLQELKELINWEKEFDKQFENFEWKDSDNNDDEDFHGYDFINSGTMAEGAYVET